MVRHTAETYREAAGEQLKLAIQLHTELGEYGAAHYWAGVAVECMLRAYRLREDPQFDSRHDLVALVKQARLYDFVRPERAAELAGNLTEVALRWSNDHRYRPSRLIERWLDDRGLLPRLRGDRMKYSSSRIVEAAVVVITMGEQRWLSKKS